GSFRDDTGRRWLGGRPCLRGPRVRRTGDLPAGLRPDPRHRVDATARRATEFDLQLARICGPGRANDWGRGGTAVPVRGAARCAAVGTGPTRLGGRGARDGRPPGRSMAAEGPDRALAR